MKIVIETSCGETFEMEPSELDDYQLTRLIERNAHRADLAEELTALRAELARREIEVMKVN
jgi:hypothetical protein